MARRPRQSQLKRFVAPVAGWVANRALADPSSIDGPAAEVLDNFFPRASAISLRRGAPRYATIGEDPVRSLFSYKNGLNHKLFAATDAAITDITAIDNPYDQIIGTEDGDEIGTENDDVFGWSSVGDAYAVGGFTSGYWSVAQFAATGQTFLIGVNGVDTGFIYDGSHFYPYVDGGVWSLSYDAATAPFEVGETVTGGTSGATGIIHRIEDSGGTGKLFLLSVTGTFEDDEALTGSISGAATVNGLISSAVPGPTFTGGLTSANMSFVWVYKNRLFFIERNSMNAWYAVDIDAAGGSFDVFPLAGVFPSGGSLLLGSAWSMESSGDGGLSEQCVFISTEGDVAVYQGGNPSEASDWAKVGTYRIGRPLGDRAIIRGGGDLAIATTVGLVPLSKAISLDVTALNVATISYKIADAWSDALNLRGDSGWNCMLWPEGKMAVVSPPNPIGLSESVQFISNTETGAWCRFTGWDVRCMEVFRGKLYFGSDNGAVYEANTGGNDDGATYFGVAVPMFEDLGTPANRKIAKLARVTARAATRVVDGVSFISDFSQELPAPPTATPYSDSNTWGSGTWGESRWSDSRSSVINSQWRSVGGSGYRASVCYQVTSGSQSPIDVEIIDFELMYETAEMVT